MRSTICALCFLLAILSCQKKTASSIITDFENTVSKSTSFEYDIHYKMKYFSSDDDTLNYYTNCRLIRDAQDTIFRGALWIDNDSIDRYYDREHIYIIDHREKAITRYFPHEGQEWAIKGNTVSGVLDAYFLRENRLSGYLQDSTITATLTDSVIDNEKYRIIAFRFADELPIEKQQKTFYFNKRNALKRITYSVKFQNEWQYNEWHFSDEQYDAVETQALQSEMDSLMAIYALEDYEEPDETELQPLAAGADAPPFSGLHYQANDSIALEDYWRKYVVLESWYKVCFPCIKAIPFLNRLNEQFSDEELVVLGLNPIDGVEKNRKKLPDFIEINKMNYPIVFIDRNTTQDYNVRAYPTFYVLDKQGKIIYSKMGYGEDSDAKVDSLLNAVMK